MALHLQTVPGDQAVEELARIRRGAASRNRQAFLIGNPEEAARLQETIVSPQELEETRKGIAGLKVKDWLQERRAELEEDGVEFDDDLVGSWAGEIEEKGGLSLHRDFNQEPLKKVLIAEAPVSRAWQIPAAVGYGGWNACPETVVHGAMFKRWEEQYGAEILALSSDTIECEVSRPPHTQEQAMALAWEQYLFCEDIVTQGVGSISALGGTLLNSPYWFFWWD